MRYIVCVMMTRYKTRELALQDVLAGFARAKSQVIDSFMVPASLGSILYLFIKDGAELACCTTFALWRDPADGRWRANCYGNTTRTSREAAEKLWNEHFLPRKASDRTA